MDDAQERLDKEHAKQNETNDGMSSVQHSSVCGHPDSNASGSDINEVSEELDDAVDEP